MTWHRYRTIKNGGSAPATLGFNAVAPEWLSLSGAAEAAPAVPAPESTLGSHPCVALSSAQVISEWINRSLAVNAFPANGDNPLNFVSHSKGSLQTPPPFPAPYPRLFEERRTTPAENHRLREPEFQAHLALESNSDFRLIPRWNQIPISGSFLDWKMLASPRWSRPKANSRMSRIG